MTGVEGRGGVPWPGAWAALYRRGIMAMLPAALVLCLMGLFGVLLILGGSHLAAVVTLGCVLWFLPMFIVGLVVKVRSKRSGWPRLRLLRLQAGNDAVLMHYHEGMKVSYLWLCFAGGVLFISMPIVAAFVPYDGSYGSARFHSLAPVFPIGALYAVAFLASRVVRKRGELGLGLSPTGVYHWSWFGCCFYAWEWIREIKATDQKRLALMVELIVVEPDGAGRDPEENFVARWDWFRAQRQSLPVQYFAVNPAVPYYALGFYRRHPELRHELGTQEGVDRIRRGDLPDVIEEVREYGRFRAPSVPAERRQQNSSSG